ncbi:lipocalin family protein [Flavobacterium sp. CLA17]|uniref:lipocalin family protein n=1 Tax=Flavobacterium sp. CLA17 TaxID=2724135 RepID=UPI001490D0C1|nr:lipocalin family protein [Flavobacterium sp. CLA17]QSB26789.1 lipocalin family protein [Flavobacterium sp. CLA17]
MKQLTILFLFITALGLTFTSCSNDSDNDNNASIVGKWEFSQYGIGSIGQEILTDRINVVECGKDYMEFLSDGTYKVILFRKENGKCITLEDSGKYTKNGSTLSLIKNNIEELEPADSEIIILNNTTLKIRIISQIEKETVSELVIFKKV